MLINIILKFKEVLKKKKKNTTKKKESKRMQFKQD